MPLRPNRSTTDAPRSIWGALGLNADAAPGNHRQPAEPPGGGRRDLAVRAVRADLAPASVAMVVTISAIRSCCATSRCAAGWSS